MQVPIHIMSGWCVASFFVLTPRERFFCMAAASLEDLDGLGAVMGTDSDAYQDYHHLLCHNLTFILVVAVCLTIFSRHRIKALLLYIALGHLHLLLDYFGSGPGWGIAYWYPFSRHPYRTNLAWNFFSWQNMTTAGLLLAWTIAIAIRQKRTPVELITPDLDRRLTGSVK